MLKKTTSFVLVRPCRLNVSRTFTNLMRLIQHVVHLSGSTYGSQHISPLRLPHVLNWLCGWFMLKRMSRGYWFGGCVEPRRLSTIRVAMVSRESQSVGRPYDASENSMRSVSRPIRRDMRAMTV